jgi:hypothetical protein
MRLIAIRSILSSVVIGLAGALFLFGLFGMMSPTVAYAQSPNDDALVFEASFPESSVEIRDLSGNPLGEGLHGGLVLCGASDCTQATVLTGYCCHDIWLTDTLYMHQGLSAEIEYGFTIRQSLDPVEQRAVVGGTGTISRRGETVGFSFTATFQNNRDGTVSVTYVASRPEASFVIPRAPGTFAIVRRQ